MAKGYRYSPIGVKNRKNGKKRRDTEGGGRKRLNNRDVWKGREREREKKGQKEGMRE